MTLKIDDFLLGGCLALLVFGAGLLTGAFIWGPLS